MFKQFFQTPFLGVLYSVFLLEEEEEEEAAAVNDIISNFKISKKNEKYIFKIKKKIQKKYVFYILTLNHFCLLISFFCKSPCKSY